MWTKISNEVEWTKYLCKSASSGISVSRQPTRFPCLVSSLLMERTREIYHAFVYLEDFAILTGQPIQHMPIAAAPSPSVSQDQFNRWVAAHVMALTYYVVESGLCGPGGIEAGQAAYENKLLQMLESVDESIREGRTAGAVPYTILDPKHEATP